MNESGEIFSSSDEESLASINDDLPKPQPKKTNSAQKGALVTSNSDLFANSDHSGKDTSDSIIPCSNPSEAQTSNVNEALRTLSIADKFSSVLVPGTPNARTDTPQQPQTETSAEMASSSARSRNMLGAADLIKTRPDHNLNRKANQFTSTPNLGVHRKKMTPLDDLDVTAIGTPMRNRLAVSSDSSDDDDNDEYDCIVPPTQPNESEQLALARQLKNISIQQDDSSVLEIGKRQRGKGKVNAARVIESSSEGEEENFQDAYAASFNKENTPAAVHSDDDDATVELRTESPITVSSPEVEIVHDDYPRVVPPPRPRVQQSEQREPLRTKLLDFPPPPPTASVRKANDFVPQPEILQGVDKTIAKLAKTIEEMPIMSTYEDDGKQPSALKVDLHEYQRYGLNWLCWRESQFPGGGILGDEMGLGKTIMMISLLCKSKENQKKKDAPWLSTHGKESRLVPSKTALVVCPYNVLHQWDSEIRTKALGLSVHIYHGSNRTKSASYLTGFDVVLTTFDSVAYEVDTEDDKKSNFRPSKRSPLTRINWERIILDEGHVIRNPSTQKAKALCKLTASHKWIVTGTPVHNKPSDMFSLVKFLGLTPFTESKVWDHWIGLKSVKNANVPRLRTITKALLLRRTKDEVIANGSLGRAIPPKTVKNVEIDLSEGEREVFDYLYDYAKTQFSLFLKNRGANEGVKYVRGEGHSTGIQISTIFALITRLRQFTVLPYLIHVMLEDDEDDSVGEFDPEDIISRKNPIFQSNYQSAKIRQLLADLDELKEKAIRNGTKMDKVVVVSEWTSLLDTVRLHLHYAGYSTVSITGKVSAMDRQDAMGKLNAGRDKPQVMLLSLVAGGVGLNLIGANHMIILEPHWNPQLELQAMDRIHRFGQKKECRILRYICKDSFEGEVIKLQDEKLQLAQEVLSSVKKTGGGGLTINDMRKLFNMS